MKLRGLIGFVVLFLYQIPFSRTLDFDLGIPDKNTTRPILKLDYNYMTPGPVVEGKYVVLKCIYSQANETHPAKEYRFHFNGTKLTNRNPFNITLYGDLLVILNANETHVGTYYCNVKNSMGEVWRGEDYFLKLHDKTNLGLSGQQGLPIVRISTGTYRENQVAIVSRFDNVPLKCSVEPNTTLIRTIHWLCDGEKIESHQIDGRTFISETLTLKRIAMNQTGVYACQVDTFHGVVISGNLPIYVLPAVFYQQRAPNINLTLTTKLGYGINPDNIQEYDEVYMTCEISPNTTKFFNVTWNYDYKYLPENVENGIIYENTKLILKHVKRTSSGLYTCSVDTDLGVLNSNTDVIIQVKENTTATSFVSKQFEALDLEIRCPDVSRLLQLPHKPRAHVKLGAGLDLGDIEENDNIYFTCEITPITAKVRRIRWFVDNKELFRNEEIEIYNHPSTLVFPCIQRKFAGNISCMAMIEDDISPRSNNLTLKIYEPIKEEPPKRCEERKPIAIVELLHHPRFIYIDQPAIWLHCHIHPKGYHHEIVNITWFHYNQDEKKMLTPSNSILLYERGLKRNRHITTHGHYGQTLIIHRVNQSDMGDYRCQVLIDKLLVISAPAPILDIKDPNKIAPWKINIPQPIVTTELVDNPNNKYENDFVFFYCNIKPKKTLQVRAIHWFRENELLDDLVDRQFSIRNQSLRLNYVQKHYVGDYFCQIETDGGTFRSETTSLELQKGKKTYRLPWDTGEVFLVANLGDPSEANNIYEKYAIYFVCEMIPPTTAIFQMKWFHNDTEIYPNNDDIIFNDKLLYLYNIPVNASGRYRCEVDTKKGLWKSPDVYLTVHPGVRNITMFPETHESDKTKEKDESDKTKEKDEEIRKKLRIRWLPAQNWWGL